MTRRDLLNDALRTLEAAGVEEARRHAEWLVMEVLSCNRAQLYAYPEQAVRPAQADALRTLLTRRARREPLQYILGYAVFYGLRLRVTPDVLIPRPETEQVVEAVLAGLPAGRRPRVLDVGTGSGCIALSLKHARPDAAVTACDVSPAALAVARANAAALGLDVAFVLADVLAPAFASQVSGSLDVLVSNPPYLADDEASELEPEVHAFEPHRALFAGADPLRFYHALARHGRALLAPDGRLVLETHALHAGAVASLLTDAGYADVGIQEDLAGHPRIVTAGARRHEAGA